MATEYGGLPALVIFLGFFLGSGRFFRWVLQRTMRLNVQTVARTFKYVVLSRNGARFTSLKGNSKQSCHFAKEHMKILYRTVNGFSLFLHSSNAVYSAFLVSKQTFCDTGSIHAMINFIGNHFETYFCQVLFFKKSSNIGIWVFWYRMHGSFKENISTNSLGQFWLLTIKIDAKK